MYIAKLLSKYSCLARPDDGAKFKRNCLHIFRHIFFIVVLTFLHNYNLSNLYYGLISISLEFPARCVSCLSGTRGIVFSSHQDANEIIKKIESAILAQ